MSKKDSTGKTVLLLGAGALAAYFLFPKVKEAVQNAVPSITFPPIDIGGLIPEEGIPIQMPGIGDLGDLIGSLFGGGGGGGGDAAQPEEDITDAGDEGTTEQPSWWDNFKGEALKVAEFSAGVGLGYVGIRYAGPPIARGVGGIFQRLFGKVGPRVATTTAPGQALAGEGLGPASATKGFKLKYPKVGPLGAAAFALSFPDLLAATIGLLTGQPTEQVSGPAVVSQPYEHTGTIWSIPVMSPGMYSAMRIPEIIAQNQPAYGMGAPMEDWFTNPATGAGRSGGGGGGGSSEGGGGGDNTKTTEKYDAGEYGGIGGTGQWVGGL